MQLRRLCAKKSEKRKQSLAGKKRPANIHRERGRTRYRGNSMKRTYKALFEHQQQQKRTVVEYKVDFCMLQQVCITHISRVNGIETRARVCTMYIEEIGFSTFTQTTGFSVFGFHLTN